MFQAFNGDNVVNRFPTRKMCVLLALTAVVLGCAEPVEDISFVQPHYTSKSIFTGEWHYKQTIVDMSPEASLGFVGLEADLEKVSWEIKPYQLVAYRIHEAIPNLDQNDLRDGSVYRGDPVAVFPIISHFDIRRSYNAMTGEETNVVVENALDRPWFDREFMRVDWSQNIVDGPVSLGFMNWNSLSTDYIRETELTDPDSLLLSDEYIQVTQQVTVSDGSNTCYMMYGNYNCGSSHGRTRLSFARIDNTDQYEPRAYLDFVQLKDNDDRNLKTLSVPVPLSNPREYRDFACTSELLEFLNESPLSQDSYTELDCVPATYQQFGRFGFFRAERYSYDRQVGGGHDENRMYNASHHNIWQDPYRINSAGERISKPFKDRTPKPIIYYLNVGFPDDLKDTAGVMSNDWDEAFFKAVVAGTQKSEDDVRALIRSTSTGEDWMYMPGDALMQSAMFQIRENTCSPNGLTTYLNTHPQFAHVLDGSLDVTGMDASAKIRAGLSGDAAAVKMSQLKGICGHLRQLTTRDSSVPVFVWQQVGDVRFSILNWINEPQPSGPLGYGPSAVDKETGEIVAGSANMYGASIDTYARSAADIVRAMNQDLDFSTLISGASYADWFDAGTSFGTMPYEMTEEMAQELRQRTGEFDLVEQYGDYHFEDGRVDAMKVMAQADKRLADPVPGDPMYSPSRVPVDEAKSRLDTLRADPMIQNRLIDPNTAALVRQLFDLRNDEPLTADARNFAMDLQTDPANVRKLSEDRFKFFSSHNMYHQDFLDDSVIGQALALKGEDPEVVYQTLRKEIFRAVALHEIGHTVGMTHNFEASRDALNYPDEFWQIRHDHESDEARIENRLPEYRYASIMDYGSRFNADTKGLGKYDLAAIKFGYGHVTEKFSDDLVVNPSFSYRTFVDGYEVIPELLEDGDGNPNNNYLNITKRDDMPIEDAVGALRNGLLENAQRLLENPNRSLGDYWRSNEVPYGYCFDIFRGNLNCQVWDEGTSYTETVRSAIQNYWNYFVFTNYRRGRYENSFINGFLSREGRVGWYLTTFYRFYYFYQQWNIGIRDDLLEASLVGLNFINQVLGTPEPGQHCLDQDTNMYQNVNAVSDEALEDCQMIDVPNGVGRTHNLVYSDDYYWPTIDYIGSFYAKIGILYYLSDTSASFFRVSNTADQRFFSIGYYRVFKKELLGLLRSMMFSWLGVEQGETYQAYAMAESVMPRALVAPEAFGQAPGDMVGTPQVKAPMGYNTVFQALLLSTVYNTSSYDSVLDFDEYLTISESGSGDDRTYPDDWDVATFVHPQTGVTYRAAQTSDDLSLGHALLTEASSFVANEWLPARGALELAREDGESSVIADAQSNLARLDLKLGKFTDIIGDLRYLRGRVDRGED
jgi:hypothetical protein